MSRRALLLVTLLVAAPVLAGPAEAGKAPRRTAAKKVGAVHRIGRALGFTAGFTVTVGLALSRKWNAPMRDEAGRPVTIHANGHDFTLRARHAAVLGPKISAHAATMPDQGAPQRALKRFVTGFGEGATRAPPAEGRFEGSLVGGFKRLRQGNPSRH